MTHPFELSGLGKAPFKLINLTIGAESARCEHCGTKLMYVYVIQSADGKLSGVGCDCVCKTEDGELKKDVLATKKKMQKAMRQKKARIRRELRAKMWAENKITRIDNDLLPFDGGKYAGKTISELKKVDPQYLVWLCRNYTGHPLVLDALNLKCQDVVEAQEKAEAEEKARKDAEAAKSDYVGNVKDKMQLTLTVKSAYNISTYMGTARLTTFVDEKGNQFTTFSNGADDFEAGDTVTIKFTVKGHREYQGTKQTNITRVKKVA